MTDSTTASSSNGNHIIPTDAISNTPDANRLSAADLCKALVSTRQQVVSSPCFLKLAFCRSHTSDASIDFEKACEAIATFSIKEKNEVQTSLEKAFEEPRLRHDSKSPACHAKVSEEVSRSVPVVLAVALPLLEGALPRDEHGTCVIPHKHGLRQRKVRARIFTNAMGKIAYDTRRACDNCDNPIEERIFYSCAIGCEVDFCASCHSKLEKLFNNVDKDRANWVVEFVEMMATFVLQHMSGKQRSELAQCLASDWPQSMFERFVAVVVDVADALVVHVQDNSDSFIESTRFWHVIGLLQVLYSANGLSMTTHQSMCRSLRMEASKFAVRGIDKCDAHAEYGRWRDSSSSLVAHAQALVADTLEITQEYATFLAHSNLVPISFRQRCLQNDVRSQELQCRTQPQIKLGRAPREKLALSEFVVNAFGSARAVGELAKELCVTFKGEPAAGPGVVREFLCLSMASLLEPLDDHDENFVTNGARTRASSDHTENDTSLMSIKKSDHECDNGYDMDVVTPSSSSTSVPRSTCGNDSDTTSGSMDVAALSEDGQKTEPSSSSSSSVVKSISDSVWEYDSQLHVYWFRNSCSHLRMDEKLYATLRACGVILGQVVHAGCMLPTFFPQVLYAMLLQRISPQKNHVFTLSDLGAISPAIAQSLDRLLEYEGDDLLDLFRLDWPRGGELTSENREEHVRDYVQWFFSSRYASQVEALSDGFRAVVGHSKLLQAGLVDAAQLEQIICGAEMLVDVAAIQAGATTEGWLQSDAEYLEAFWKVLQSFQESELRRFVLFVSSCSRAPPRGWQDLSLNVQRNGDGDDRLPTAFTCFNLLLLPRYSSKETLRKKLLLAIAETQGFGLR